MGATDGEAAAKAVERIRGLTESPKLGTIYTGKVSRITDFGAFIEILPGVDGLVHKSQLAEFPVNNVRDVVKEGDEVMVMITDVDPAGKISLSRSTDGGRSWQPRVTAVDRPGIDDRDPAIFQMSDGTAILTSADYLCISKDNGITWGEPRPTPVFGPRGAVIVEDRVVVRDFFHWMRSLPPEERRAERKKIWTWRALPSGEREEAMRSWSYYRGLSGRERETLRWFLFARPGERPPNG